VNPAEAAGETEAKAIPVDPIPRLGGSKIQTEVNAMIRTVEAVIDENGGVHLLEPLQPGASRRALVTILEESPLAAMPESALLSEAALSQDWNRPEEDEAWAHLSQVP
jgi:hypothetical protein